MNSTLVLSSEEYVVFIFPCPVIRENHLWLFTNIDQIFSTELVTVSALRPSNTSYQVPAIALHEC